MKIHSNATSYQPGEDHGRAVLTEADVRRIRQAPKHYGYRQQLARIFKVSVWTIDDVRNRKSWSHIS